MGERKVLNKYYPADFDPSKLPRLKQPKNQQVKVRMSVPMSMICNTCGNYLNRGTKFNMRKEQVANEFYLQIPILRFYFKCTNCCMEITFKTDPQNSHYAVESGANCRFKEDESTTTQEKVSRENDDAMKCLENRTLESKREMDSVVALEELMCVKSMQAKVKSDELLALLMKKDHPDEDKKNKTIIDEAMAAKSIYSAAFKNNIKRVVLSDDEEEEEEDATERRTGSKRTKFCSKKSTQIMPDLTPTNRTRILFKLPKKTTTKDVPELQTRRR